ncbi:MAG: hypothetical protein DMG96_24165 [Acidobacteria bacterium]|nr:MAG: hypothetical protein DMG96_24165 [Acidobacteriota bacterium]
MQRFTMTTIWLLIFAFVLATMPGPLRADSASFHYANASASGLDLVVTFKETGLGNSASTVGMVVNADAMATYQCFNNGGNHPKAGNKETVNGPVTGSGNFLVRHGQTTGFITVSLPGPGNFSCPSGQTLFLISGEFDNITITDLTTSDGPVSTTPSSITVP